MRIGVIVKSQGCGTYRARVIGNPKLNCSCTAGEVTAALSLRNKYYGQGLMVRPATQYDRDPDLFVLGKRTARTDEQIRTKMNFVIEG